MSCKIQLINKTGLVRYSGHIYIICHTSSTVAFHYFLLFLLSCKQWGWQVKADIKYIEIDMNSIVETNIKISSLQTSKINIEYLMEKTSILL